MEYVEMRKKKTGELLRVYDFVTIEGTLKAVCWSPELAGRSHGSGFFTLKANQLLPIDYSDTEGNFISPTSVTNESHVAGNPLKLVKAIFQAKDGATFSNFNSNEPINALKHRALQYCDKVVDKVGEIEYETSFPESFGC